MKTWEALSLAFAVLMLLFTAGCDDSSEYILLDSAKPCELR